MAQHDDVDSGKPDLRAALRRARVDSAQANDAVIELRSVEISTLKVLQNSLRGLIEQVPQEHNSLFDVGLVPGFPPRLWIDILSYVEMAADRETYVFVRETRLGRRVLAEHKECARIVDPITDYVARRVIEREKALAEDMIPILERREISSLVGFKQAHVSNKIPEVILPEVMAVANAPVAVIDSPAPPAKPRPRGWWLVRAGGHVLRALVLGGGTWLAMLAPAAG